MKRTSLSSLPMYGPLVSLSSEALLVHRVPDVIPSPSVNVWDQCLKFGTFRKENVSGQMTTTVFDEETVGQMMDYFRDHENDLWMDSQHGVLQGKGQALCYHNALCMVAQGQVTRFESKGTVKKPMINDLRRPDGTLPENGLFAHRYQLTSLGLDPKEGIRVFKWVSPLFEQKLTYRLINITATNDPFLDGVALAYQNFFTEERMMKNKAMDEHNSPEEMMKDAGCNPDDPVDEKLRKMTAYAKKIQYELNQKEAEHAMVRKQMQEEHQEELNKAMANQKSMEDESEKLEGKEGTVDRPKGKALFRKKFSDDDKKEPQKEALEDGPQNDEYSKESDKKEQAMARRIYRELGLPSDREMAKETMSQLRALPNEMSGIRKRLETTENERASEKRMAMEREAQRFADGALRQKRWKLEHKGTEEATRTWLAQAFMRSPKDAEDMLQPVGTFGLASAMVMERYTEGGAPYGTDGRKSWLSEKNRGQGASLNKEALRIQAEQEKATAKPFGYERAFAMAERRYPELAQAYSREILNQENI